MIPNPADRFGRMDRSSPGTVPASALISRIPYETPVPGLDPGRGRTKKGYFWAIARDDRPWSGTDPPAVVYTYAPGRAHKHGLALLGDFRGILQVDRYPAYQKLADPAGKAGPSALAFCW